MGVNGLWSVIQPCARPTNLASLNRKRLAVDASIWIYQFLKAVRDKEGNALRNSHVVGFFRRICKLLWFGVQPVFVFDGGAPALKRATIQKRQRRREGRRDDAVKTAGKLLAVQMQRLAEEDNERKRALAENPALTREEEAPVLPDASQFVYVDEIGMSQKERQQNRKFHKQDAYHLPELDRSIASMGQPDDPRIMSVEELEEYARQFNDGEDINLYDFSKIDFDGDFFKSLPPPDRYNILNAARLRSRLRMGLSKEQLDEMFPDRMAFSRFQIERVKERNHLTQRLMYEVGMTGTDLTLGVNARVAGEKNREYILVKNDGVEGGWALGVVSKDKEIGEAHKPIDVDAIQIQYQAKDEIDEDDEDEDFEDVPIAGINRLPKLPAMDSQASAATQSFSEQRRELYTSNKGKDAQVDENESLFVGGPADAETSYPGIEAMHQEEEDDLNFAIALSLQNQHTLDDMDGDGTDPGQDLAAPKWKQTAVKASAPIVGRGGMAIAHMVNRRANASMTKPANAVSSSVAPVTKPKVDVEKNDDSDSDEDMQTLLSKARMSKKPVAPLPVFENKKNPFDGPLPFPKLSWGSLAKSAKPEEPTTVAAAADSNTDEYEGFAGGGFEPEINIDHDDVPKPLPPWLADDGDIRDAIKKQVNFEREKNAEDKEAAVEAERQRQKERMIEIESSDDDSDDVQIVDAPNKTIISSPPVAIAPQADAIDTQDVPTDEPLVTRDDDEKEESPEPDFEDVNIPDSGGEVVTATETPSDEIATVAQVASISFQPNETVADEESSRRVDDEDLFGDAEDDEYSDPDEEELLQAMELEAAEHARFASELNQKSAQQNREDYERELRALRTQQKKDRRDADEVTQVMITECQALLRLFGIPYITAPMEAEAQCAELVKLNIVDGIVTDDSDTFLFGGTRVYKNMFNSNKFVECYVGADLEKELSLSREQLISLAQLLGSDYTDGIPGVGPVTAVEILSEFPGASGLSDFRDWWNDVQSHKRPKEADVASSFRKKFRKSQAAKLFLPTGFPNPAVYDAYLNPDVDHSAEPFQWGVPDVEGLRRFLMATIGWSKERTDEVLVPVVKDMNKREREGTQSNITRYFDGTVGAGARDASAPRQKAQSSKRMAAAVDKLRTNTATVDSSSAATKRRRTDKDTN